MEEPDKKDPKTPDTWASGEAYEAYVGRWSRIIALKFLEWLGIPDDQLWLDVGCGTGGLVRAILESAAPRGVTGVDSAEGFLTFARARIPDSRVTFRTGDAGALPVESAAYNAIISGFALNFFSQPDQAVSEMVRAARSGGSVAAYVWDYAGRVQFMRHFWNAASALNREAARLDEGRRFPLCHPEPLANLFIGAGLTNVEVTPIDIWTVFKDFDDYWMPFLGGQGPAPGYTLSLNTDDRIALREALRRALPFAVDGTIPLMARAWAIRGER